VAKRVSYEIIPGVIFPKPAGMVDASYRVKAVAQRLAEALFEESLLSQIGLLGRQASYVAAGGWQGGVNPSGQVSFAATADDEALRVYAAALGLIWKQDAVAISHLHPDGAHLAVVLRRPEGRRFTPSQAQRAYERLYQNDAKKTATIGFFEADGALVFINGGELSDDEFKETIFRLAAEHLSGEVELYLAKADFQLEWTDWSNDHGERYRQRIREAGRSDILHWIEAHARGEAEAFIHGFNWKTGKPRPRSRRESK
jgi:hypothetical protein